MNTSYAMRDHRPPAHGRDRPQRPHRPQRREIKVRAGWHFPKVTFPARATARSSLARPEARRTTRASTRPTSPGRVDRAVGRNRVTRVTARTPQTGTSRARQLERVATMSANASRAVRTGPSGRAASSALASAARATT